MKNKALGLLLVVFFFLSPTANAVIEVGDDVPEFCWLMMTQKKVCHPQFVGNVRVLIYGAGWCPECNKEMAELAKRVGEFDNQPVTFISLSAQGDLQGTPPTAEFLKSWKERHNIPFLVAASFKDAGRYFFAPPLFIPNVVIIGRDNRLAFKAISPSIDVVFAEVRKAIGR